MAYLGPPPSQKLATPTSQYFSGNGSATAFTLNRPVNVAEDLNVFVNNVAQQPGAGKSYTATGTTLTFDAAPDAGTNNVYVVYRGLAEATTRLEHDANQALAATTGTFSGDLTVDTTTLKVDSTNNRVGIGNASPATALDILNGSTSTGTLKVQNASGASASTAIFEAVSGGGTSRLLVRNDGKTILSGGGLTFGGDTADANALDDYEEGTWTPAGSASSGTAPSFSASSGTYTKIGRLVTIHASCTNVTAGGTSNAQVQVTGLPFTPDVQDGFGACNFGQVTIGSAIGVVAVADASEDRIVFMMNRTGAGRTGVDNQHIDSGVSDILFSVTYITNQ